MLDSYEHIFKAWSLVQLEAELASSLFGASNHKPEEFTERNVTSSPRAASLIRSYSHTNLQLPDAVAGFLYDVLQATAAGSMLCSRQHRKEILSSESICGFAF